MERCGAGWTGPGLGLSNWTKPSSSGNLGSSSKLEPEASDENVGDLELEASDESRNHEVEEHPGDSRKVDEPEVEQEENISMIVSDCLTTPVLQVIKLLMNFNKNIC